MTETPRTPARKAAIDDAFAAALDLPEAERAVWLAGLRARDEDLSAAVERLLAHAARPDPRLDPDRWAGRPIRMPADISADPAWPGKELGPYRVLREIGRGGMSVVYLAERVDGLFEQRVALKFVGALHPEGIRRFERERQILAGLTHPGIARLLDGGSDEQGRPFIVMEHVEGRPLDVYCRETRAGIARRLELVGRIDEAVEYAHRHLVVHRDLKPSNILVTDDGQVKLLDFGIAKLLEPVPADPAAPTTRTQFRPLTPEYASPEQIRGERITTASDIYQLGVLLYELLTGRRPSSLAGGGRAAMEREICYREPPRPSVTVARERTPLPGIEPSVLRRRLRGDLDAIILKALAPEPERRYASIGELRDDLQRYRQGIPVRARVATPLYRAAKFVRRHRTGVAASAVLAVLALGYVLTVTVHSRRLMAEAAKTRQVKEILVSLLSAANPGVSGGREPTVSELLELGARRVAELQDQPNLQAELMALLGEVYGTRGRYEVAAALLEPALELRRRHLRPADPELARTAHQLGRIRHIQGRLDEAEALMREAIAIRSRALGERNGQVGVALDELGDLLHTRGDLLAAEAVLGRALAILSSAGFYTATTESHLANVMRDRGAFDSAEALYRRSLATAEGRFGTVDPIPSLMRSELAVLLAETGRHAEADSLLEENLQVYETLYPGGHAMVGTTWRNLGILRLRQGHAAQALRFLEDALAIYEETLGPETSLIPRAQRYLAEAMLASGEAEQAGRHAAEAIERLGQRGLAEHPAAVDLLEILALSHLDTGRPVEAADLLARALAGRKRLSLPGDPRLDTTSARFAAAIARVQLTAGATAPAVAGQGGVLRHKE